MRRQTEARRDAPLNRWEHLCRFNTSRHPAATTAAAAIRRSHRRHIDRISSSPRDAAPFSHDAHRRRVRQQRPAAPRPFTTSRTPTRRSSASSSAATRRRVHRRTFDEDTGATTLGDLTPAPVGDDDPNADLPGSDLFAIYVEESDAGSFIAVSGLDEDANPPEVRPYEGNVTLTVRDLQDNGNWTSMSTDDGTGVAFLAARSPAIDDVDDSEDRPILSSR